MRAKGRRRHGFTLIELLIVVVIIGILASVAMPSFINAQDRARNAAAGANLNVWRTALESYGADNNGFFPDNNDLFTATGLLQHNYLPGNRPPLSPWCKRPQVTRIQSTIEPTLPMEEFTTGGNAMPAAGTPLTPATAGAVGDPPTAITHYGAMTSDTTDGTDRTGYVLFMIGKKGGKCIMVRGVSNKGS